MPNWHDVKVVSPQEVGRDSYIELDGVRVKGVTKVEVIISTTDVNRVIVSLLASSVNVETEVEIVEPISDNGKYDAVGNFIHDDDCNFLGQDHVGKACFGIDPRPQQVDEPYHEWHNRTGVKFDGTCYDCGTAYHRAHVAEGTEWIEDCSTCVARPKPD